MGGRLDPGLGQLGQHDRWGVGDRVLPLVGRRCPSRAAAAILGSRPRRGEGRSSARAGAEGAAGDIGGSAAAAGRPTRGVCRRLRGESSGPRRRMLAAGRRRRAAWGVSASRRRVRAVHLAVLVDQVKPVGQPGASGSGHSSVLAIGAGLGIRSRLPARLGLGVLGIGAPAPPPRRSASWRSAAKALALDPTRSVTSVCTPTKLPGACRRSGLTQLVPERGAVRSSAASWCRVLDARGSRRRRIGGRPRRKRQLRPTASSRSRDPGERGVDPAGVVRCGSVMGR